MPRSSPPVKVRPNGRPVTPPGVRLVAYGLHLSPDKKDKLFELKTHEGVSVRDWIEKRIEYAYQRMVKQKRATRTR